MRSVLNLSLFVMLNNSTTENSFYTFRIFSIISLLANPPNPVKFGNSLLFTYELTEYINDISYAF